MKNKLITYAVGGLLLAAAFVKADWVYNQYLVSETGLAYNKNYPLNLNTTPNAAGITQLAAQAVYSTATIATATFTDGSLSHGNITVVTPSALIGIKATNNITVAPTSLILAASATDQITVVSTVALSGGAIIFNANVLKYGVDWQGSTLSTQTAKNISNALNKIYGVTSNAAGDVVYATSTIAGASGNNYLLSSSTANITVASSHFSGGHDAALTNSYITINSQKLRQGYDWFMTGTSSGTAESLASVLNLISGVSANSAGSVVYSTATSVGLAGNAFTLTSSSPSFLTVANPTYTGGQNNVTLTINGVALRQGTNWTADSTSTQTAKNISNAIVANSSLNTVIRSTYSASVVYTTSTAVGTTSNYTMTSSTPTALSVSGATMTGGTASATTINSPTISLPSTTFTTGLPVFFTTGTVALRPLVNNTTYYAILADANDIELATTSTGAVAGAYITITSSSTSGAHTYSLAPLPFSGTPSFKWQGSNDNTNWSDVVISSVTFSTPYTASSAIWDFGPVNYKYLRLAVIGPTQGGLNLSVLVNGKNGL